ncbi:MULTISPECIES: LCP family protein [unclassified Micromonospora]|uniref:LCP family protein n=1 Tax=unclassified Micromonospora TaxID=2617518 RepID=UPI000EF4BDC6|nr:MULTISPECIES: LCP family protein [unclassified Micromonospora]RLP90114.1 LytR family transcriptional regulator [Micromonospora sp. CV4]RLP92928.1 LytR family transcriptional regulator [Micromonospora sp. BL4]
MVLGSMAPRRRWLLLGLAALAIVALVAAGAVVVTRLTGGSTPEGAAPPGSPSAPPAGTPSASPTGPPPGANITGPLNLLLVGVDTRVSVPGWEPHADAVLVLHVPKGLGRAYLFSLPRDLLVDIPAFPKADYSGGKTKLTHAMSFGSRVPGKPKQPSAAQGYELLRSTVSGYTGLRIDAGAVLTFTGFDRLVTALGGVDVYIDQRVESLHRRPDGKYRESAPGGYKGPQMVYEKGDRHLNGWQALDYARQRYITGGDYARQRHQQQLIRALTRKILDEGLARQPERVDQVVAALGDTLIYVGGRRIVDLAYALSNVPEDRFVLVGLPGSGVGKGSAYRGEQLTSVGRKFITELRAGRADAYLAAHPTLRVKA